MDRPRSLRRLMLSVGTFLLGTLVALASLRSWAQDPERRAESPAPPPSSPPKEALRYDGKSFDQWRTTLLTELKPEKRIEAITALTAFGLQGYAEETTAAILHLLGGFGEAARNDRETYNLIEKAASEACPKLGAGAIPTLRNGLKGPNPYVRQFVCQTLAQMKGEARDAVPDLIAAMMDKAEDLDVRRAAIWAIKENDLKAKGLIPSLTVALKDEKECIRAGAAELLGEIGKEARSASPFLVAMVKDEKEGYYRYRALDALGKVDAITPELVPLLAGLLKDNEQGVPLLAARYLGKVGPKEAMPAIKELLRILDPPPRRNAWGMPVAAAGPQSAEASEKRADPSEKAVEEVLKHIKK